jgi:hypothetical protein
MYELDMASVARLKQDLCRVLGQPKGINFWTEYCIKTASTVTIAEYCRTISSHSYYGGYEDIVILYNLLYKDKYNIMVISIEPPPIEPTIASHPRKITSVISFLDKDDNREYRNQPDLDQLVLVFNGINHYDFLRKA